MKLSEYIINYGTKSCTLQDYLDYSDNVSSIPDLMKIPVLVYMNRAINDLPDIPDDEFGIDTIISESYGQDPTIFSVYLIKRLGLKEVPEEFLYYTNAKNEDQQHDALYHLLNKIL